MPIAVAFSEPATLVITAAGTVTFAEVAVVLDDLIDDDRIGPGTCVLVDARAVEDAPSTPELRLIARDLAPLHERGVTHMAVCAESTFIYGVARMFAVFAELIGMRVAAFRNMDDAQRWLASFDIAA
jgi:hypothetical protein